MSPLVFLVFFKIVLAIRGPLRFHMISEFSVKTKCHGDFDRDCIESVDFWDSNEILTIVRLPIHKHGMCFHLLMSLVSFSSVL